MQHDDERHPALPLAPLFDGQAPTLPHYGGVELVLDEASLDIMEMDLLLLPAKVEDLLRELSDLRRGLTDMGGYFRVVECHTAFLYFYAPSLKNYELPRFWAAALDTALIWEVG